MKKSISVKRMFSEDPLNVNLDEKINDLFEDINSVYAAGRVVETFVESYKLSAGKSVERDC